MVITILLKTSCSVVYVGETEKGRDYFSTLAEVAPELANTSPEQPLPSESGCSGAHSGKARFARLPHLRAVVTMGARKKSYVRQPSIEWLQ